MVWIMIRVLCLGTRASGVLIRPTGFIKSIHGSSTCITKFAYSYLFGVLLNLLTKSTHPIIGKPAEREEQEDKHGQEATKTGRGDKSYERTGNVAMSRMGPKHV